MTEIWRLSQGIKRLSTEEFLSGEKQELEYEKYEGYLEEVEEKIKLDGFDNTIDEVIDGTEQHTAKIDRIAAPEVHRTLPLTRRQAADEGIWHYLTVIHRPDFVRHRWEYNSRRYMEKRFFGCGEWDTNTLYRLWWAAELTEQDGDYSLTREIFTQQSLVRAIFDRDLCMYQPAVHSCVESLHESNMEVIEETMKRVNKRLTTVQLEGRSKEDINEIVVDVRDDVESEL